jgi:hypothetical protein
LFPKKETNVDTRYTVSNNDRSEDPNALLTPKEKRKTQRKYSLYSLLPPAPSKLPQQARLGIHRQLSPKVLCELTCSLSFFLLSFFLLFSLVNGILC